MVFVLKTVGRLCVTKTYRGTENRYSIVFFVLDHNIRVWKFFYLVNGVQHMALTKAAKKDLAQAYQESFADAKTVIVVKQSGVPVNAMSEIRKELARDNGTYTVVKKRVFLKSLEGTQLEMISLDDLNDSVAIVISYEDEFAPLKVVNNHNKSFKKDKKEYGFEFLGGWFDGQWKDAAHVTELADIPSQEELISKLLYLIKYPLQSLTMVADQIAKKATDENTLVKDLVAPATETVEEKKEEAVEATDEKTEESNTDEASA